MSNGWSDDPPEFGAHLRSLNARRLRFASWYVAVILMLLVTVNLALPSLRLFEHASVTFASALYFLGLGLATRSSRASRWPTPMLPLLFGVGMALTAIVFSVDLAPSVGANPAYSTLIFFACLAPVWPQRLLLVVLIPAHLTYLATVFGGAHSTTFVLVMTIGGTAAAALGGLTALLASRAERQSFEAAESIRRQKEELAAALAQVERLLEERREMVAMAAHDLKSPLAGIRALLLTISDVPPSHARKLDEISRTCGDMYRAIAGLIAAHAAETAPEPTRETVEVEALFGRAVAAAAPVAADKDITLRHAAHACRVHTDPATVGGMLDNLLSNAIKFSPPGAEVWLEAQQRASAVRLCVSDSGPGIAEDDVPRLFKKFSRLSAQPTGAEASTGLGLYIVRIQAERIGARVGCAPNPGGGSIFFLDLPPAATEEMPVAARSATHNASVEQLSAGARPRYVAP